VHIIARKASRAIIRVTSLPHTFSIIRKTSRRIVLRV
jgi:hypothetical protein